MLKASVDTKVSWSKAVFQLKVAKRSFCPAERGWCWASSWAEWELRSEDLEQLRVVMGEEALRRTSSAIFQFVLKVEFDCSSLFNSNQHLEKIEQARLSFHIHWNTGWSSVPNGRKWSRVTLNRATRTCHQWWGQAWGRGCGWGWGWGWKWMHSQEGRIHLEPRVMSVTRVLFTNNKQHSPPQFAACCSLSVTVGHRLIC